MTRPWKEADEIRLLLSILALTAPKLPDWDDVSRLLDGDYGASGARQHYQFLRKRFAGKLEGKPFEKPKPEPRRRYTAITADEYVYKTKPGQAEAAAAPSKTATSLWMSPSATPKATPTQSKSKSASSKAPVLPTKRKSKSAGGMTPAKLATKRKVRPIQDDRDDEEIALPCKKKAIKLESDIESDEE